MKKENGIYKKKRSFHRWLAWFMAAVLLMGECNLTVLAEEGTLRAEESEEEASDEGLSEGAGDDGTADGDNSDEADGEDADDIGGEGDIGDADDITDEDNAEESICVCDSRCSEDRVNEDCPVCVESYVNCIGQENGEIEEGDGSMEGELPEGNVSEAPGLPELAGGGNKWCSGGRQYG